MESASAASWCLFLVGSMLQLFWLPPRSPIAGKVARLIITSMCPLFCRSRNGQHPPPFGGVHILIQTRQEPCPIARPLFDRARRAESPVPIRQIPGIRRRKRGGREGVRSDIDGFGPTFQACVCACSLTFGPTPSERAMCICVFPTHYCIRHFSKGLTGSFTFKK